MYKKKEVSEKTPVSAGRYRYVRCDKTSYTGWTQYDRVFDELNHRSINYEVNPPLSNGRFVRANNCHHLQYQTNYVPITGTTWNGGEDYVEFEGLLKPYWFIQTDDFLEEPTPEDIRSMNALAFEEMKPSLESDLNLTNFLFELTDLISPFKMVKRWKGKVISHIEEINGVISYKPSTAIADVLDLVASGHLTWSFGIKPFISDVKNLYKLLREASSRIADFERRAGQVQRRHWRKVFSEYDETSVIDNWQYGDATHSRKVGKTTFHVTMVYRYECPDMSEMENRINALCDMMGLRLGLAQIWEALPWTFVLDWFGRVEDFLQRQQQPLTEIRLEVIEYILSYKVEASLTRDFWHWPQCNEAQEKIPAVATATGKLYVRRHCLPESGSFFVESGHYGPNQLALSASLLWVNRP